MAPVDNVKQPGTARALVGWLRDEQAVPMIGAVSVPDPATWVDGFRQQVHRRPAITPLDLSAALQDDTRTKVVSHVEQLRQAPAFAPFAAQGWTVQLVDLREVRALQHVVFWSRLVPAVEVGADVAKIAALTLPLDGHFEVSCNFDPMGNSFLVTGPSPNLTLVPVQLPPTPEGRPGGFGFAPVVLTSFLQVAVIEGRLVLRDGLHRAVGLLSTGQTHAPALVRTFAVGEALSVPQPGLFDPSVYLSDRAPRLPDYLDDTVSADVQLPECRPAFVISANRVTVPAAA